MEKEQINLNWTSSSYDQKKKLTFDLTVNRKIKTLIIDKPEMKGDLQIPVIDVDKSNVEIGGSFPKGNGEIEANILLPKKKG
jgi:hypothetical protein